MKCKMQKQPPRGIFRKRCSENMQQNYGRTPIPKCDFNKVAKQLVNIRNNIAHYETMCRHVETYC